MKKFLALLLAAAAFAAADCRYTAYDDVKVGWTAFKTPMKVGVSGVFKTVSYQSNAPSDSLQKLLKGSEVSIDTGSVDSGNTGRDGKLVQFFFDRMKGKTLKAGVVDLDEASNIVLIHVIMNGKELNVPMAYTYDKGLFNAKGVLDLGDFAALDALHSINKACYEMHQGKTWQDVRVVFSMKIKEQCAK